MNLTELLTESARMLVKIRAKTLKISLSDEAISEIAARAVDAVLYNDLIEEVKYHTDAYLDGDKGGVC